MRGTHPRRTPPSPGSSPPASPRLSAKHGLVPADDDGAHAGDARKRRLARVFRRPERLARLLHHARGVHGHAAALFDDRRVARARAGHQHAHARLVPGERLERRRGCTRRGDGAVRERLGDRLVLANRLRLRLPRARLPPPPPLRFLLRLQKRLQLRPARLEQCVSGPRVAHVVLADALPAQRGKMRDRSQSFTEVGLGVAHDALCCSPRGTSRSVASSPSSRVTSKLCITHRRSFRSTVSPLRAALYRRSPLTLMALYMGGICVISPIVAASAANIASVHVFPRRALVHLRRGVLARRALAEPQHAGVHLVHAREALDHLRGFAHAQDQ